MAQVKIILTDAEDGINLQVISDPDFKSMGPEGATPGELWDKYTLAQKSALHAVGNLQETMELSEFETTHREATEAEMEAPGPRLAQPPAESQTPPAEENIIEAAEDESI